MQEKLYRLTAFKKCLNHTKWSIFCWKRTSPKIQNPNDQTSLLKGTMNALQTLFYSSKSS